MLISFATVLADETATWISVALAALNVIQTIALAYLAAQSHRGA